MWTGIARWLLLAELGWHLWSRRRGREREAVLTGQLGQLRSEAAQAAARAQTQREALFHSMVEGLLLLDEGGRIQLANRAFLTLFPGSGDPRGRTLLEVSRHPALSDLIQRLTAGETIVGLELEPDGAAGRCLEVNAAMIRDDKAVVQGAVLVFHDLTRLKLLERQGREFVANVSHELRTPLSIIKGYVETLLGGAKDDPATATKFLQTIERHSDRLARLIEDLLASSEIESGRALPQPTPLALRPLVTKVLDDFAERARHREVRLLGNLPELTVLADADRLQQVLGNLVDNAVKYGRPGGLVTVSGQARDTQFVQVCVRDDGPGLPPEAVGRVFERFYRVDRARSRETGGSGLGLSIVKAIVEAHGGEVWVESQPRQGATFCFTLPRAERGEPVRLAAAD